MLTYSLKLLAEICSTLSSKIEEEASCLLGMLRVIRDFSAIELRLISVISVNCSLRQSGKQERDELFPTYIDVLGWPRMLSSEIVTLM
jgi:hypothetical protein